MTYTNQQRAERIQRLLQTPRVYWTPLQAENKVDGLVDLCVKYLESTDTAVEVGCFSGVSSRVIALHCGVLHCVDPYNWEAVAEAEQMFDSVIGDYPNILKVKLPSVEAAKLFEDGSIDFVYIDADHAYDSVVEDISAWRGKVKAGGYIAGHDSHMGEVLQAVRDCLGEPIEIFADTSWIVRPWNSRTEPSTNTNG